jgi:hypothetical protein
MFTSVFLAILLSPLPAQVLLAAERLRDCDELPQVRVLHGGQDVDQPVIVHVVARAADDDAKIVRKVVVVRDEGEKAPTVWIGVRLTPVPAPLAAHIGEHGVMVANVVADSPADKAGLQRYDVITSLAGSAVNQPQELVAAVAKVESGKSAKFMVVRQGKPQELEITPVERPAGGDLKLKYEEPEEGTTADAINLRGLTLNHGPDGRWMLRDLGPMKGWPDALKELHEKLDLQNIPGVPSIEDEDEDAPQAFGFDENDEEDSGAAHGQAKVEVRVKVENDGQSTTIVRETDGKIQVARKDADGKETTATYDNAAALREADPSAYKLYRQHDGTNSSQLFQWHAPNPAHEALRREYQLDVEKKVKEALGRAREARAQAQQRTRPPARERVGESRRVIIRHGDNTAQDKATEKLLVRLHDDGSLTVVVAKEGGEVTYEFKSQDAFKAAEPEIYEQVKGLLE